MLRGSWESPTLLLLQPYKTPVTKKSSAGPVSAKSRVSAKAKVCRGAWSRLNLYPIPNLLLAPFVDCVSFMGRLDLIVIFTTKTYPIQPIDIQHQNGNAFALLIVKSS
jgi:hypothetical protein